MGVSLQRAVCQQRDGPLSRSCRTRPGVGAGKVEREELATAALCSAGSGKEDLKPRNPQGPINGLFRAFDARRVKTSRCRGF